MNDVQSVHFIGHESPWRHRVVELTAKQLLHTDGASVATWEPVAFSDLTDDCVFVADDFCVIFSINLADPLEWARYQKEYVDYHTKPCGCAACVHYRSLSKRVGKDRMPAAGSGCTQKPVEPMRFWWRIFVRENLTGVAYVKMWDRNIGEYREQWYRFTGCKHEYDHRSPYNCYHEYSCPKCGHKYAVDSSD